MSKHAYYHGVGYHLQELKDIWVREDGPYAATASLGQNHGYWVGIRRIKQYYGELNEKNRKKNLEMVSKLYPEIENVKENEGIGSMIMHTLTRSEKHTETYSLGFSVHTRACAQADGPLEFPSSSTTLTWLFRMGPRLARGTTGAGCEPSYPPVTPTIPATACSPSLQVS